MHGKCTFPCRPATWRHPAGRAFHTQHPFRACSATCRRLAAARAWQAPPHLAHGSCPRLQLHKRELLTLRCKCGRVLWQGRAAGRRHSTTQCNAATILACACTRKFVLRPSRATRGGGREREGRALPRTLCSIAARIRSAVAQACLYHEVAFHADLHVGRQEARVHSNLQRGGRVRSGQEPYQVKDWRALHAAAAGGASLAHNGTGCLGQGIDSWSQ